MFGLSQPAAAAGTHQTFRTRTRPWTRTRTFKRKHKASALEVRYSMFGLSQPAAAAGTHQTFRTRTRPWTRTSTSGEIKS